MLLIKGGPGHRDDYLRAAVLEIVYECSYNNIVEQDHRAIKRRCSATHGFKAFERAAVMISGLELATAFGSDNSLWVAHEAGAVTR